ncbi:MAG: V-type ATP synthase subunit A, partial [Candidatus Aenigmarchaeota archaeon]|nr:V-type ATP synthase subunit A [Candidatus Aenigmarchaeota archaeon]
TLEVARLLREFFLQQNAFHEVDTYCDLKKTHLMLKTILMYQNMAKQALDAGVPAVDVLEMQSKNRIAEVKFERDYKKLLSSIEADMKKEFSKLK